MLLPSWCYLRRLASGASAVSVAGIFVVAGVLAGCAPESPIVKETAVPNDWELDQAGILDLYHQQLADLADAYMLDSPPDVDLVRFVSSDEWATIQVQCLTDAGIGAEVGPQGGIVFDDVPQDQADLLNTVAYTCAAEYPVDPRSQLQLPLVRAKAQYDHLVKSVAPCVRNLGYDVSEPPSQQAWLDSYYTGEDFWDPYSEVAATMAPGSSALDEIYAACPHDDPNLYPPVTG